MRELKTFRECPACGTAIIANNRTRRKAKMNRHIERNHPHMSESPLITKILMLLK